jgi:hypothetical protein
MSMSTPAVWEPVSLLRVFIVISSSDLLTLLTPFIYGASLTRFQYFEYDSFVFCSSFAGLGGEQDLSVCTLLDPVSVEIGKPIPVNADNVGHGHYRRMVMFEPYMIWFTTRA